MEERTKDFLPGAEPGASVETFTTFFEAISEGMALVEHGRITAVNHTAAMILGRTPAELIGSNSLDLLAPPFRAFAAQRSAIDYERPSELGVLRPDGTIVPIQMIARSIRYDGRMVRLITFQDISERYRAEAALRASEARFRALVQHSSDVTIIRDLDGTIRYMSPMAEEVFGYTVAELIGRNRTELIHPDDFAAIAESVARIQAEPGVHAPIEYRVRRRDGTWRFLEGTATNLLAEPSIAGIVVNAHDITKRKLVEQERDATLKREQQARHEAEAAVRARDEFLAIASHELKTPLTVIKGNADLLARQLSRTTRDEARLVRLIARVQNQLERFEDLVNDLLDLSRLQHGQLSLRKQLFDLSALAAMVIERLGASGEGSAQHPLTLDAPRTVLVIADAERIEQVLTNLLGNAIKYSPEGGAIDVEVSTETDYAVLRVLDHGIGMAAEEQKQIFEPFRRTSAAMAVASGVGIGLYVTAQIIARHGGTITVTSQPGQGSCFTVRVPLGDSESLVVGNR